MQTNKILIEKNEKTKIPQNCLKSQIEGKNYDPTPEESQKAPLPKTEQPKLLFEQLKPHVKPPMMLPMSQLFQQHLERQKQKQTSLFTQNTTSPEDHPIPLQLNQLTRSSLIRKPNQLQEQLHHESSQISSQSIKQLNGPSIEQKPHEKQQVQSQIQLLLQSQLQANSQQKFIVQQIFDPEHDEEKQEDVEKPGKEEEPERKEEPQNEEEQEEEQEEEEEEEQEEEQEEEEEEEEEQEEEEWQEEEQEEEEQEEEEEEENHIQPNEFQEIPQKQEKQTLSTQSQKTQHIVQKPEIKQKEEGQNQEPRSQEKQEQPEVPSKVILQSMIPLLLQKSIQKSLQNCQQIMSTNILSQLETSESKLPFALPPQLIPHITIEPIFQSKNVQLGNNANHKAQPQLKSQLTLLPPPPQQQSQIEPQKHPQIEPPIQQPVQLPKSQKPRNAKLTNLQIGFPMPMNLMNPLFFQNTVPIPQQPVSNPPPPKGKHRRPMRRAQLKMDIK
ncbi:hypothetical protein TRFO_31038 [Tritrichomonas foetus]|uniref:Uncharacterized protein n=1 Tax=Tritrichomonas foetus TaxID=1144522 RepID=A0A1J4JS51_9EUKA|nr:hypothetical protein TRFO_31038 [Tritrichomonas foetus]|eukprot:OHT01967.1 hypothetical protein TRFO_31038 [Tritrichomonas foetus]